jgi:cytosine/adenosine deaminase-related metal-dependent hydrolase
MKSPGLVNAHTHLYSALAALGLPEPAERPRNFVEILERVWWRLDRALDEHSLRASARLYVAEALLHGTTTLVDHHESPGFIDGSLDVVADACDELGVRAFLCYGATERNAGRAEARAGLAECTRFARANRRPLVRALVGLHASFTCGDDTLADAAALCRDLGTVLHVHVAEDKADVEDARRRGWGGPLERLLAASALPQGSVLAHGVHLSADEVRATDLSRLWLVHNPRSNQGNGVGWAGGLAASRRVALGTDGFVSDMRAEEAALTALAHANGSPAGAVTGRLARGRDLACELYTFATHLGVGAVAASSPSEDRVEWRTDSPAADHLAARVIVGGHTVVEHGRLVNGDLDEIRAHAREEVARLRTRMEALT